MERLTARAGSDVDFDVTLRDSAGVAVSTYTGSEPLALVVWPGEDRAAVSLPNSTVTWNTPPVVRLHVDRLDTAALAGRYDLVVKVTDGPDVVDGFACELWFDLAPGAGAAPKVYGSRQDIIVEAGQLLELLQARGDTQTAFARERGLAREWADSRILAAAPYDRDWIAAQLAADKLLLTGPDGRRIVRACSLYAASLILKREPGKAGDRTYRELGAELEADAEALLSAGLAWIDTDGDGTGDYGIHCGVRHLLRG